MHDYLIKAEQAIEYLRESEESYSSLKAQHQAAKERLKVVEASKKLDSGETSDNKATTKARASNDYGNALRLWEDTLEAFYLIEAKRKRAELTIEMYRSVNSALKKGNI